MNSCVGPTSEMVDHMITCPDTQGDPPIPRAVRRGRRLRAPSVFVSADMRLRTSCVLVKVASAMPVVGQSHRAMYAWHAASLARAL